MANVRHIWWLSPGRRISLEHSEPRVVQLVLARVHTVVLTAIMGHVVMAWVSIMALTVTRRCVPLLGLALAGTCDGEADNLQLQSIDAVLGPNAM